MIAGACLLAILARIAQAAEHHRELKSRASGEQASTTAASVVTMPSVPASTAGASKVPRIIAFALLAIVGVTVAAGILFGIIAPGLERASLTARGSTTPALVL